MVNSVPAVQPEDRLEEERWIEYRRTGDPALRASLRESFIKQYVPLVKYVAGKVAIKMPQNVEFDDLVGWGAFGLIDAIDKYDPEKNVKFKTYAVNRIRGQIYDELRQIDWVPRSVRQKTREIETAVSTLEAHLGRSVSDREVAKSMGLNEDEYLKTIHKISGTQITSLNDAGYSGDDKDKVSILDSIESPSSLNPEVIIEKEVVREVIIATINELPDKERKILILYYYEDLTLRDIGRVLQVTESRVSQLHSKAIGHLRSKLTNIRKGIV